MREYYFFIVEGPHDSAAVGRLLRPHSCKIVRKLSDVDEFWSRLIPRNFPYQDDLLRRMPIPTFYQNDGVSIAIYSAGGEENIPTAFDSLLNISIENLSGIAVFFDADEDEPKDKFARMHKKLIDSIEEDFIPIIEGLRFNEVKVESIRCGFFVFPNNMETGTLESVLLEGGEIIYAEIMDHAKSYLENVPTTYTDKWNTAKHEKSLFGVMANVLKPGSANQVSIQYDEWISNETIEQTSQQKLKLFIEKMLN